MSTTAPVTATLTKAQGVWLVAERELGSKLRSKAFLISTAFLFVVALGAVVWGGFAAQNTSATPIAVAAGAEQYVDGRQGFEITNAPDAAAAEKLVASGDVDAAVIPDASSPTGFTLVVEDSPSTSLLMSFAVIPKVTALDPSATDDVLRYFIAIGFGLVFMLSAQVFGSTIAQSVVEEKQTRVVELLISAVPTRVLMAGKVLGNTILAMAQILVLVAIAVVGLTVTGQVAVLQGLGTALVWFAIFFLFGFVLLAALFAAAAAMVSRQEDIGSTTTPLILLIMAPYFLVIFFNDNPVVLTVMSYVPFSAPVGMPMRLYLGEAQWWEPLVSLAILAFTCLAAIAVGAKIYENSILRMGGRVKLKEALKA